MSVWRRIITPTVLYRTIKQEVTKKSMHNWIHKNINITSNLTKFETTPEKNTVYYNQIRCKSKQGETKHDLDNEADEFDDDSSLSKDSKVVKFSATSMRTDMILKSALGISRNKVEQMFYESKIRLNGKKVLKKSISVKKGDEIDVIKMISPKNPEHLYVARIEVVSVVPEEDCINITARRFKNLLIENYEIDPHQ